MLIALAFGNNNANTQSCNNDSNGQVTTQDTGSGLNPGGGVDPGTGGSGGDTGGDTGPVLPPKI